MPIAKNHHMTVDERRALGREARKAAPRASHGSWTLAPDRPDRPVARTRRHRLEDLVPIRWGRMSVSPFTFYRGSAAPDGLRPRPASAHRLKAQLCGDAHLSNFGLYASPERTLVFDVNDFDETLPGPFEWDVKRLAASFVIAARNNGFGEEVGRRPPITAARAYREHMAGIRRDARPRRVVLARRRRRPARHRAEAGSQAASRRKAVRTTKKGVAKVRTGTACRRPPS